MTLLELLTESGAVVGATISGDEGVDYKFEFWVHEGELACQAYALVAGHEMAVSFSKGYELEMFEKLSTQMGDVSDAEI
jgi:hypothetical protein